MSNELPKVPSLEDRLYREVFGRRIDSLDVDRIAFLAASIDSSQYASHHMTSIPRFGDALDLLSFAADRLPTTGLVLEFGVFSGRSINHLANRLPGRSLQGFDSFEGLPEDWRPGFAKGAFAMQNLPAVPENVELIKGWFDRSLPTFLDRPGNSSEPVAFLHVDCDLYSSTKTIFSLLSSQIRPGTIIVFDEYFNYPGWQEHEFKAFQEYVSHYKRSYRYIGLVPSHQQVAVEIIV